MLNQALGMTITRIAFGTILFAHGYILKLKHSRLEWSSDFLKVLELPQLWHILSSQAKSLKESP